MAYDLTKRLVIGLASSALFDLEESDKIFRDEGEEAYREFQKNKQNKPLERGVAFAFIKRLLNLNQLNPKNPPVEVILLSRNDPDTGLRVMNSIEHYNLGITRAVFLQGTSPHKYIPSFDIELFLSANHQDVQEAVRAGYPAGKILKNLDTLDNILDNMNDHELRLAFDFDGVIADDEAEKVYQTEDLANFQKHERSKENIAHNPGPLKKFLSRISDIQKMELEMKASDATYTPKIRVAIVTARNAPSHKRVINTMREWGVTVNEAFFLGGVEKIKILEIMRPHIFFDDQTLHLESSASILPSVHIPFGIRNSTLD